MTWLRFILAATVLILARPAMAQTPQTGTFAVTDTPAALIGNQATAYAAMTSVDTPVTFVVHVPATYDPSHPPGILAYISPTASGDMPAGWADVLDRDNLIWISARDSGNDVETRRRIYDVILALAVVQHRYAFDGRRVYLAGFSGGGRTASEMMATAPYLFDGAIYICGAEFHRARTDELAARMMDDRYVFVTGGGDFNRSEIRSTWRAYVKAGAGQAHLMDLDKLPHVLPDADGLAAAITALDTADSQVESTKTP